MGKRTTERNRQIAAALRAGYSRQALAERYALTRTTIGHIISGEQNREAVSRDPYYEALRVSLGLREADEFS